MTKYRIVNPNNKEVREYLPTLSLCKAKKFRTMEFDNEYGQPLRVMLGNNTSTLYYYNENLQLKTIKSGKVTYGPPIVGPVDPKPLDATTNKIDQTMPPLMPYYGENIQKWVYEYNVKGLMSSRQDSLLMQKENFTYDNLDRLTNINQQVIIPPRLYNVNSSISYDNQGNIQNKTDIGAYSYDNTKPNAISSITEPAPSLPSLFQPLTHHLNTETQDIQYNLHNKIEKITQGNKELNFYYTASQDRIKTVYKENNIPLKTIYYIGNYECEVYPNGRIRELNYINTNTGHTIVELKDNNNGTSTDSLYYIFKDHLGSYDRITNQLGQIVETYSFDAWGNRRNPNSWQYSPTSMQIENYKFTRGFTGHEHMDKFQLINMNGRLYDPVIARFLSPDPYVANNTFTQDFNRYSYCRNNPLLYTDPSGEWIHLVVGAAIGGVVNWAMNGAEFSWRGLGYFGVGALAGASGAWIGGAAAGAVGTAGFWSGMAIESSSSAISGFVLNGGNSWMESATFKEGLLAGGKGALIGGIVGGITGGIGGGLKALEGDASFWTGKMELDLSQGAGNSQLPQDIRNIIDGNKVKVKYAGKFEYVKVYETGLLKKGNTTYGVALPPERIVTGTGTYNNYLAKEWLGTSLLQHEYGHILQAKIVGLNAYYKIIAPESLLSMTFTNSHETFWTETWANYLAQNYFGEKFIPIKPEYISNVNIFNLLRLMSAKF